MKYIRNIIRILDILPLVPMLMMADQQYKVTFPVSHDICLHVCLHSLRGEVQSVSKQIIRCILKGIQNPLK